MSALAFTVAKFCASQREATDSDVSAAIRRWRRLQNAAHRHLLRSRNGVRELYAHPFIARNTASDAFSRKSILVLRWAYCARTDALGSRRSVESCAASS